MFHVLNKILNFEDSVLLIYQFNHHFHDPYYYDVTFPKSYSVLYIFDFANSKMANSIPRVLYLRDFAPSLNCPKVSYEIMFSTDESFDESAESTYLFLVDFKYPSFLFFFFKSILGDNTSNVI